MEGRRTFGTIERRRGAFRARYFGPDRVRYEAPRAFTARLDAEHWLAETQREISRGNWKPRSPSRLVVPTWRHWPATPDTAWPSVI